MTPTRSVPASIFNAAGTNNQEAKPANNNPKANFKGVDGSLPILINFNQIIANTGDNNNIHIELMDCHHVDGNSLPKTELFVFLSVNKVKVLPAC